MSKRQVVDRPHRLTPGSAPILPIRFLKKAPCCWGVPYRLSSPTFIVTVEGENPVATDSTFR